MAKLTVKLTQHTPIIHFQHEQEGAAIRPTEIKHYLTQYIKNIGKYYKNEFENKINEQFPPGNGIYRISIEPVTITERIIPKHLDRGKIGGSEYANYGEFKGVKQEERHKIITHSQYFGDIKEMLTYQEPVVVTFFSFDLNILTKVYYALQFIFALENFGARANKGFGSFSVLATPEIDWDISKIDGKYDLEIGSILKKTGKDIYCFETNDYKSEPYKTIFYFYNALKGGINEGNDKYFKSLLWKYYNRNTKPAIIWEKRLLKQKMFKDPNPNPYNLPEKYLRVLLGFTSEYVFRRKQNVRMDKDYYYIDSYGKDRADEGFFDINNDTIFYAKNPEIERSTSPITFKPIKIEGGYRVYIILKPELYTEVIDNCEFDIRKQKFTIQDHKDDSKVIWKVIIPTIPDFDLNDFIKWACSEINKNNTNVFFQNLKIFDLNGKEVMYE